MLLPGACTLFALNPNTDRLNDPDGTRAGGSAGMQHAMLSAEILLCCCKLLAGFGHACSCYSVSRCTKGKSALQPCIPQVLIVCVLTSLPLCHLSTSRSASEAARASPLCTEQRSARQRRTIRSSEEMRAAPLYQRSSEEVLRCSRASTQALCAKTPSCM